MLKIYGVSDDLIEFEGDFEEEICLSLMDKGHLALSDGTLLSVKYDGDWTFRIVSAGTSDVDITPIPPDQDDIYSDVVSVNSLHPIKWVVFGKGFTI